MKRKGFTLIELMGVLIILGILAAIAVPTIAKTIKNSREKAYEDQVGIIVAAAKNWSADHISVLPEEDGVFIPVKISELQEGGYLESSVENPKTQEPFNGNSYVLISRYGDRYNYEFHLVQ